MIKIKMEKIIDRGDQMLRVLEIEMLEYSDLPLNYTQIGESVYLYKGSDFTNVKYFREFNRYTDNDWLRVGEEYSAKIIKKRIEIIRRCGKRLQEINRLLNLENKGWDGTETIII
ncbi:hypothetical protein KAR91_75155 [Candidatus Pacearchaeota archaeon]|nr:hypothetical protein [Candidatus Pacearchaeota archaeon]